MQVELHALTKGGLLGYLPSRDASLETLVLPSEITSPRGDDDEAHGYMTSPCIYYTIGIIYHRPRGACICTTLDFESVL